MEQFILRDYYQDLVCTTHFFKEGSSIFGGKYLAVLSSCENKSRPKGHKFLLG